MLHLFSAETVAENDFPDEQIRTVIHALRKEGKVREIIYHTENKESFRYVISTEIQSGSKEKVLRSTTSVDKFRLLEEEYLEFIQDTLDGGLVRERQYSLPFDEEHDDHDREEHLRPIAIRHLRCIEKIERLSSAPKPHPAVQQNSSRTTCLLFTLLIALIGGTLYYLLPLFTPKYPADLTLLFNTVDVQVRLGTEVHTSKGNRLDLTLPLGRYKMHAEKQGFKPVRQDIFLSADEEVMVRLEELHSLTLFADIEESSVLLDGKTVGKPVEQEVSITEQNQELPISLEKFHHRLSVIPDVADTSVSISCKNGQKYFGIAGPDSPFQLETAAASCTILAENQGYQPVTEEVSLTKETASELSVNLKELFLVTLYTNLDFSTVLLDGREAGTAGIRTPTVLSVPGGSYLITVSNPQAGAPVEKRLRITEDQLLKIDLPLPRLTVTMNVAETSLLVDKKKHQVAGKKISLELSPGSHRIIVRKEGYITLQREVFVQDGVQTFFELRPQRHPFSVISNIDKTDIYVKCKDENEYSGLASPEAPFHFEAVAGSCTISADRKGYEKLTRKVTVPAEKELSLHLLASVAERQEKIILRPRSKKQAVQTVRALQEIETKRTEPKEHKQALRRRTELQDRNLRPDLEKQSRQEIETKRPDPKKNEPASLPKKKKTQDCQKEISIGMPELCNE